ncbi:MAG: hypothetical protein HZA90_10190 [Verrucomicrobia bacterium]|nr:hypothetical protein [Verrucomicrobiota bacterium]
MSLPFLIHSQVIRTMKTKALSQVLATVLLAAVWPAPLQSATVDTVLSNSLHEPFGIVSAGNDVLYVADGANHRIGKFDASSGSFVNLAGLPGTIGTNNGSGAQARFYQPQGMTLARGGLIVADSANHLIRFVSTVGAVSNLAGVPLTPGHVNGEAKTARFRYPLGVAADANGNIFIADSMNNAIRLLDATNNILSTVVAATAVEANTIVIPDLYQPAGVLVTASNWLWIANTRNHTLHRVDLTARTAELVAGTVGQSGTDDSVFAAEARLNMPRGMHWSELSQTLIICDSGNHTLRRLYFNTELGVWSMTTYAGVAGEAGAKNGPASSATFNNPSGIAFDLLNRSYLVTDRAGNQIRRVQEAQPLPPVVQPQIGVVRFVANAIGELRTVLVPVSAQGQVFDNNEIIAMTSEDDAKTYFTGGPTPEDLWADTIPDPSMSVTTQSPNFTGTAWRYVDNVLASEFFAVYDSMSPADRIAEHSDRPPDFMLKAVGAAPGRRSSPITKARFVFQVAKPSISGDNAADFRVETATDEAQLWYTTDGTMPTNRPPSIKLEGTYPNDFPLPLTNAVMFKVGGFKNRYLPSVVSSNMFWPSNYVPNRITFGFENGEGSSDFQAAAGQQYFAPVTLSLLPNQFIYSMQFALTVTNTSGAALGGDKLRFTSMLMKPIAGKDLIYEPIPPVMSLGGLQEVPVTNIYTDISITNTIASATNSNPLDATNFITQFTLKTSYGPWGVTNYQYPPFNFVEYINVFPPIHVTNVETRTYEGWDFFDFGSGGLVVTNYSTSLLGVGWLERRGEDTVYDTKAHDLIRYSQARNRIFDARTDRQVFAGAYGFPISSTAPEGDVYRIEILRPSATSDGIYQNLRMYAWTNGSLTNGFINAIKHVQIHRIGRSYVVGDAEPFRWVNAGEFGDRILINNDVMQAFQSAEYGYNVPPVGSDLFDAMDSSDGSTNSLLNPGPGNDYLMDNIHFGDGQLNVDDVYVTFRRSLDPALKWYARFWSNGVRAWVEVPNNVPGGAGKSLSAPKSGTASGPAASVTFLADDVVVGSGGVAQVPIRATISAEGRLKVLMLSLTVDVLDGSPELTQPPVFTPVGTLGTPTFTRSFTNGYAAAWLNPDVEGLTGSSLVGSLTLTLPTNATAASAYRVRFLHASASPNGLGLYAVTTADGLTTRTDRSASSWGDGISDGWRLKYFGTLNNLLSAATADADGDEVPNRSEFRAGTNPNNRLSALKLRTSALRTNAVAGVRLQWPTVPNRRYVLECSTRLGGTNWLPVASDISGDGTMREFLDTNPAPAVRFYRVRVAE